MKYLIGRPKTPILYEILTSRAGPCLPVGWPAQLKVIRFQGLIYANHTTIVSIMHLSCPNYSLIENLPQ